MTRATRILGIAVVVAIFFSTLLAHWPVGTLWALMANRLPSSITTSPANGTLLDGRLQRVELNLPQGWPIALGPLNWHWSWPATLAVSLGDHQPWQLQGSWRGLSSHWSLSAGDLAAVSLEAWPATLSGQWQGRIAFDLSGAECTDASGTLTSADTRLITPSPLPLGDGRLTLRCQPKAPPHLTLEFADRPALALGIDLDLTASSANGHLAGHLDPDHPLAGWWRLVDRDVTLPDISRTIGNPP